MEGRLFLKELLNKRLRISIKDGRVIDGHFMCTDNSCNIVLSNCEEFLTQEDIGRFDANKCTAVMHEEIKNLHSLVKVQNHKKSDSVNVRTLGLAIVPGDQILTLSVQDTFLSQELLEYINSNNTNSNDSSISS